MKYSQLFNRFALSKIVSLLIIICINLLFVSGCQSQQVVSKESRIVQAVLSDPKTFNAVLSQESPNIFSLTYQGLTRENVITGEIEPALAKSWQLSDDQLSITFELKENLIIIF